jgi:hypothetical protein
MPQTTTTLTCPTQQSKCISNHQTACMYTKL